MELTLDQVLQKGIEAHKAGKAQEADRFYTAILKADPKHPDANHNMGLLAVGVGKVQASLPFFKTALETNPSIAQYWLSYIDALVKLDQLDDAKAVFAQAKERGAEGNAFDKIEQRIIGASNPPPIYNNSNQNLLKGKLEHLLKLYKKGQLKEALREATDLLKEFPSSVTLYNIIGATNQGLGKLDAAREAYKRALSVKPDYAEAYNNRGLVLTELGKLAEAVEAYTNAVSVKTDYFEAYNNKGIALVNQGKLEEAIEAYKQALAFKPDYANAYNNLGNVFQKQGKFEEAIEAYNKTLSIDPGIAETHNNLGAVLRDKGKPEEAIDAYKKAISINPEYADAFANLGLAFRDKGKLEEAIDACNKAISINPDYADAYNNLGVALKDLGKVEDAKEAYKKALSLKPNFAEAYWNYCGIAKSISEAKKWIEKCIKANSTYLEAQLTLSALQFYEGNETEFKLLMETHQKNHPYMRSFSWTFNLPKLPLLHFHRWALFDHMISLSKKDRPFYEFGVWRGVSFKYLIKTFKKGYGFDTFEGLPQDWHNELAGTYSSDGNVPKIDGGKFIVGKFEDSLPKFFAKPRPKASIINFDADLYSSTICALDHAKQVIDNQTILIFDEFIMNENWEQDEHKALEEFCFNNNYTYEVLAISFLSKQVAVKIVDI